MMSFIQTILLVVTVFFSTACAIFKTPDAFSWLEDSQSIQTQNWVRDHNAATEQQIKTDLHYSEIKSEIYRIVTHYDVLLTPKIYGSTVREFWRDSKNDQGVLREALLKDYLRGAPQWTVLLDFARLNRVENRHWENRGLQCLPPAYDHCMIFMAENGSDKYVMREFQISKKSFVNNGFDLPAASIQMNWIDENSILIATDFGQGSLTSSGYPMKLKIWKRGELLERATIIFDGSIKNGSVLGFKYFRADSQNIYIQGPTEKGYGTYLYDQGNIILLPFSDVASFNGEIRGQIVFKLFADLNHHGHILPAGSLISLPLGKIRDPHPEESIESIFEVGPSSIVLNSLNARDVVVINVLKDAQSRLVLMKWQENRWVEIPNDYFQDGYINVVSVNGYNNQIFFTYENFLTPPSLFYVNELGESPKKVNGSAATFDSSQMVVDHFKVASRDGTMIPYAILHRKDMPFDGLNPTLMYGYGGFGTSQVPRYERVVGKVWLERGGVYVITQIRGGGEYGPNWHFAAVKENKQKSFDDFAAIAEDLFHRKITLPERLGISGGSNGGLLTAVSFLQHPSYFKAVISISPVLDMLNYTNMHPGGDWRYEYGDPDHFFEARYLKKYSPYHNIHADIDYPTPLFTTFAGDDRVHPGHARKMVAKMEWLHKPVYYYEDPLGGHAGVFSSRGNSEQLALEFTYLFQKLFPKPNNYNLD